MDKAIESLIPIFGIVFTFGIPGIIIFWFIQARHKERMKLIDKGLTPEEVKAYYTDSEKKPRNPYSSLKWGIFFTFIGAGLFIMYILNELTDMDDSMTPGFMLFFGGLGFILYYFIVKSKMKKEVNASSTVEKQL
jgi:hypothetical protein